MEQSKYQIAPTFMIRMAGVPVHPMHELGTPQSSERVRQLIAAEATLATAANDTLAELGTVLRQLGGRAEKRLRRDLKAGAVVPDDLLEIVRAAGADLHSLERYQAAAREVVAIRDAATATLAQEFATSARATIRNALAYVPGYAVFGSEELLLELDRLQAEGDAVDITTSKGRNTIKHLALCLQRVCTKNETIGEFGPLGYGTITAAEPGFTVDPEPGIARRDSFLEKWVLVSIAAAINADPATRPELAPRWHPCGRRVTAGFLREDTGDLVELDAREAAVLDACDGSTPAHELGVDVVEALAARGVVRWEMEPPVLDAHRIVAMIADVERWRAGPARDRWLPVLRDLDESARAFAPAAVESRLKLAERIKARLAACGATIMERGRELYVGGNPIGEDTVRELHCTLSEKLADELVRDAEPWFDLWRDTYQYCAFHVFRRLREHYEQAPRGGRAVSLPRFLRQLEDNGISYSTSGLTMLASEGFAEVKRTFHAAVADRPIAEEWQLTRDELHCVRTRHMFPRFDEMTYPSADLQLIAGSLDAVARGDVTWMVAELHTPVTNTFHCFQWGNRDKATYRDWLRRISCGVPQAYWGQRLYDKISHTAFLIFEMWPDECTFVAPQRGDRRWRTIHHANLDVVLDEAAGDLRLVVRDTGEDIGSLVRDWILTFGFHPFMLPRQPYMPRLRCGNVILQRQTWELTREDFPQGRYEGVSLELVRAIERMRARFGIPRWVYVRPADRAMRRMVTTAQDKDIKPIYVDLESYTFMSIFARWMDKYGILELTEMLPTPEQVPWSERDGRRTFEIRTLIGPRARDVR